MQPTSYFALAAVYAISIAGIQAQDCGDTVTSDVVLSADLGPCPGDGLVVLVRGNLTIDLNGFSILGGGDGVGVRINAARNVLVKGGGISGFTTGVLMTGIGVMNIEVRDTTFTDVDTGVVIAQCGGCRVIDNKMQGRGDTGAGISVSESGQPKFRGNQISGFAAGVMQRVGLGSSIAMIENTVTGNTEGVVLTPIDPSNVVIKANTISGNTLNGMRIVNTVATLDSNLVTGNGGDGILIQASRGHTVQDNIVTGNGGRGIALEISSTASGKTIDNEARSNGVFDLFWDGTGGSCWSMNLFVTSQPDPLPACP